MQILNPQAAQMEGIILDITSKLDFSILNTEDFGHICSQTVIPIGAKIRLDTTEKKITILENF